MCHPFSLPETTLLNLDGNQLRAEQKSFNPNKTKHESEQAREREGAREDANDQVGSEGHEGGRTLHGGHEGELALECFGVVFCVDADSKRKKKKANCWNMKEKGGWMMWSPHCPLMERV